MVVVLHPEDNEGAAERKIAAVVGVQALGGGSKVCHTWNVTHGSHSNALTCTSSGATTT